MNSLSKNQRSDLTGQFTCIFMFAMLTLVMAVSTVNAAVDSTGLEEPGTAQAYFDRGYEREMAGNFAAAEADYSQVIKINPRHKNIFNHRGIVRFKIGNVQEAIGDYTIAIQINPSDQRALNNRALCFYVERNWIGVLNDYAAKKSLLPPGSPIDYDVLFIFIAQSQLGDNVSAKTNLKNYLDKRETDGLDDWYLELARFVMGDVSEQKLIENAKLTIGKEKNNRLCEAYFYIAASNELAGNNDGAFKAYRNCIKTEVFDYGEYQIAKLELTALLMGAHFKTLPQGLRQYLPLNKGAGLSVSEVAENGPAQVAGIQKSDVVATINNHPATFAYLSKLWSQVDKGDKITLGILRKGQAIDIDINLGVWQ